MKRIILLTSLFYFSVTSYIMSQDILEIKYSDGAPHLNSLEDRILLIDGDKSQYNHHQVFREFLTPQGYDVTSSHDFFSIFIEGEKITFIRKLENGTVINATYTPEDLPWELTGETTEILGYTCQKAVLKHEFIPLYKKDPLDGDLIAWFSSEFDVSMGPMGLRGLPDLILRVNYTIATAFRVEATEVKTLKEELIIPEKGITVEKEKVWKRDWSNKEIKSIKQ